MSIIIEIVGSDIINFEVSKNPNIERKFKVKLIVETIKNKIRFSDEIENRGTELQNLGFKLIDGLHIASAEMGNLDIFLSTDDDLIDTYNNNKSKVKIDIINPLDWIKEEIK